MAAITRTQFRNALYDLLEAQRTATPTLLRKSLRYRPGAIGESPVGWVGQVVEQLGYDSGTRKRTMTAEVVLVAGFPTDEITDNDPFDQLVDALVERFTAGVSTISNTILTLAALEDGEVQFGAGERVAIYRGATLSCSLEIWEGRI